jgi:hypothetical protein
MIKKNVRFLFPILIIQLFKKSGNTSFFLVFFGLIHVTTHVKQPLCVSNKNYLQHLIVFGCVAEWVRIVRIKVIQLLVLCYLIFIYHHSTFTYFTMHASSDKPTFDIRPLYFYWPTTLAGN